MKRRQPHSNQVKGLHATPVTPALGAEMKGVDLAHVDCAELAHIRSMLARHKVLFFRHQTCNPAQLVTLSKRFGSLMRLPYIKPLDDYPEVIAVLKEAHEQNMGVFGGEWHSDFSFLPEPPRFSILYSVEVPAVGGDTLWVDMAAAYAALPEDLTAALRKMTAIHTGAPYGRANAPQVAKQFTGSIHMERGNPEADRETRHPVVCVHPDTGEHTLFINPTYTLRLGDMSKRDSAALLARLYTHCTRPEFACRFRWTPNSLAIWDNRATMHYAVNDYDGHRRLMYRTTVAGEAPVGAKT